MKRKLIAVLLLPVVALFHAPTAGHAQTATGTTGTKASQVNLTRAEPGDTVWIVYNFVKPESRQTYERFLHEVFWPMGERLEESDPEMKRAFSQTRVLHPIAANEDGTYTYAFIMDPVIEGAEYRILRLLQKGYGEAEGERIFREQFLASLADRAWVTHEFIQSPR